MKKVIYLASYKSILERNDFDITYQDKYIQRDVGGCMLDVDLADYDIIIATPPCNYWSKANYRRDSSKYALDTKHLLPGILGKLEDLDKPFLVENVRNRVIMKEVLDNFKGFIYEVGRHTYFTNILLNMTNIKQPYDFKYGGICLRSNKDRQGGESVNQIINFFLDSLK